MSSCLEDNEHQAEHRAADAIERRVKFGAIEHNAEHRSATVIEV